MADQPDPRLATVIQAISAEIAVQAVYTVARLDLASLARTVLKAIDGAVPAVAAHAGGYVRLPVYRMGEKVDDTFYLLKPETVKAARASWVELGRGVVTCEAKRKASKPVPAVEETLAAEEAGDDIETWLAEKLRRKHEREMCQEAAKLMAREFQVAREAHDEAARNMAVVVHDPLGQPKGKARLLDEPTGNEPFRPSRDGAAKGKKSFGYHNSFSRVLHRNADDPHAIAYVRQGEANVTIGEVVQIYVDDYWHTLRVRSIDEAPDHPNTQPGKPVLRIVAGPVG